MQDRDPATRRRRPLWARVVLASYLIFGAFCSLLMVTDPELDLVTRAAIGVATIPTCYVIFLLHEATWTYFSRLLFRRSDS